jgi:hypothetical protein
MAGFVADGRVRQGRLQRRDFPLVDLGRVRVQQDRDRSWAAGNPRRQGSLPPFQLCQPGLQAGVPCAVFDRTQNALKAPLDVGVSGSTKSNELATLLPWKRKPYNSPEALSLAA